MIHVAVLAQEETMPEHPNVELLRRAFAAYARGDVEVLDSIFDDDVVWHIPGRGPLAGNHEGKEEALAALTTLMRLTGGSAHLEVETVLATESHAVAILHSTASRHGVTHSSLLVQVFRISGTQIVEVWSYPADQYREDEFLSS